VLGLSHAVNIAFFTRWPTVAKAALRLAKLSSTTFDSQLEVAKPGRGESPALYFEIQSSNTYGTISLLRCKGRGAIVAAVKTKNARSHVHHESRQSLLGGSRGCTRGLKEMEASGG